MCRPLRSPRATCLFVFILQPNRQPSRRVPVFGDFVFAAWAYLAIARARASFVICLRCFALRRRSHLRANACLPPCSLAGSVPQALAEALTYDCLFHPQEFEEETPKPLSWSCDFSAFHLFLGARKALPVFSRLPVLLFPFCSRPRTQFRVQRDPLPNCNVVPAMK